MKKIITLALTAALTVSCAAVNVQAAGRLEGIYNDIENSDEIHILYNDTVVEYEDVKPVNADGRVMIPFRAALEGMGADVSYNDEERLVTAAKGGTTITFTLMDDTIYIDRSGEKSTITMDVPMIIVDDRTLVPIRFMSNALGMQVGWDGGTETVVIMDYDDYFDGFSDIAPNFTKLASLNTNTLNKSGAVFDISLDASENGENVFSLSASGDFESKFAEEIAGLDLTISVDNGYFSIQDAKLNVVADGSKIYIKTDALGKLGIDGYGEWYSVDIEKLLDTGLDEQTKSIIYAAMTSGANSLDLTSVWKSYMNVDGDADFDDVIYLASMFDAYEEIDKYISVTEKENGGYSASIKITSEQFADILKNIFGSILTDEESEEILNIVSLNLSAAAENDGTKATADLDVDLSLDLYGTKMSLKVKISETSESDSNIEPSEIPQSSTDITDTILKLFK